MNQVGGAFVQQAQRVIGSPLQPPAGEQREVFSWPQFDLLESQLLVHGRFRFRSAEYISDRFST